VNNSGTNIQGQLHITNSSRNLCCWRKII